MTGKSGRRRLPWRAVVCPGRLAAPLACGGCLFAPSAAELERAGTRVSSHAIDRTAQATQDQLAALRAEERLRQATDADEAAMKSASENLALLARPANDLVVVLRDAPDSVSRAVAAQRVALSADLRREREALTSAVREEREAILGAIRDERAVVLTQTDAIAQRLADQVMTRLAALADTAAPRLVDQAVRGARDVARTALWAGALLVVAILGLPLAAGLAVGRLLGSRCQA
jgi:hypothetical protein